MSNPAQAAGRSIEVWTWTEKEHLHEELRDEIERQTEAIKTGDMAVIESTLIGQFATLDVMFHSVSRRASQAGMADRTELLTRAALKTQAASRATVQTLVLLKSPPSMNVVSGNQTNIGAVNLNSELRLQTAPSKLLEATHGERLDTLSAGISGGEDQELVPLAEIDRTEIA